MFRDLSKKRVVWTKHAARQVLEDNIDPVSVERNLKRMLELPEEDPKRKGVVKLPDGCCTLIFVDFGSAIKIVTCWRSSWWEVEAYEKGD